MVNLAKNEGEEMLDRLVPKCSAKLVVCADQIQIELARLLEPEVLKDLSNEFNSRPGFLFGQGSCCSGMTLIKGDSNPLRYVAGFPDLYNPADVAQVISEIMGNHGLTCEIAITPSGQNKVKEIENASQNNASQT